MLPKYKLSIATSSGEVLSLWWIKEWICSEIPITICTTVETWLCQGSQIWPKCDITRRQRSMRALISFTLQRNLPNKTTFGLFASASMFRLTGWFHIHLFLFIYDYVYAWPFCDNSDLLLWNVRAFQQPSSSSSCPPRGAPGQTPQ